MQTASLSKLYSSYMPYGAQNSAQPAHTQNTQPLNISQVGGVGGSGSTGMFGSMDESMIARMEASLAAVADIKSAHHQHPTYSHPNEPQTYMNPKQHFSFPDPMHNSMIPSSASGQFGSSLTQLTNLSVAAAVGHQMDTQSSYSTHPGMYSNNPASMLPQMSMSHPAVMHNLQEQVDCDPRELETFAERFKQRRIKLGVTQADVGKALGNLKLPGVGSLSQSTICRFESLTLSHNNMIALKPVLSAWLDDAERIAREAQMELSSDGSMLDKKRKRTSIAAPEKRSLEAYFAIQPRPSGEKIAQIADKLELKKNVVRVWFCNQRQKQKRMKFAAAGQM